MDTSSTLYTWTEKRRWGGGQKKKKSVETRHQTPLPSEFPTPDPGHGVSFLPGMTTDGPAGRALFPVKEEERQSQPTKCWRERRGGLRRTS